MSSSAQHLSPCATVTLVGEFYSYTDETYSVYVLQPDWSVNVHQKRAGRAKFTRLWRRHRRPRLLLSRGVDGENGRLAGRLALPI
ncbi:MAG TPA: hypothetical protein VL486_06380, partial [Verrucomicrobiae bacterium]|nr:hypothetical protein [Verrucomicrobiae bacterium]